MKKRVQQWGEEKPAGTVGFPSCQGQVLLAHLLPAVLAILPQALNCISVSLFCLGPTWHTG